MNRVCLRCDWTGASRADACPNCGAPLYDAGGERRSEPEPRLLVEERPSEPTSSGHRGRPVVALVVAFVVVLGAATWFFHTYTRPLPSAGSGSHLRGQLVYVGDDGTGVRRLYTLDLAGGFATPGPPVGDVRELVASSATMPSWVGVTTVDHSGGLNADLYRYIGPPDHPAVIARGDLIAWGPRAQSLAVVRTSHGTNGCRSISVRTFDITMSLRQRAYHRSVYCDRILGVARDSDAVYLERRRGGATGIVSIGYERLHPLLQGYAILSISPSADMVVTPAGAAHRPAGSALYWRGNSARPPIAYADGDQPLLVSKVLAWSSDRGKALVLGSVGSKRGLFTIDASPGQGVRVPAFAGAADQPVWATYSEDGVGYVATGGRFFVLSNGALAPLEHVPDDAPAPVGPIAWLP